MLTQKNSTPRNRRTMGATTAFRPLAFGICFLLASCSFHNAPRTYLYGGYLLTATGTVYSEQSLPDTDRQVTEGASYRSADQVQRENVEGQRPASYYRSQAMNSAELNLRRSLDRCWITESVTVEDLAGRDEEFREFVDDYARRFQVEKAGETGFGSYEVTVSLLITPSFMERCKEVVKKVSGGQ